MGAPFLSTDRVASLSDTMFGVAMTLVVTTMLPSVQANKGSAIDLLLSMREEIYAVVFSFAVCGLYWEAQQRRLAMTALLTQRQVLLHLLFLFLIVLVPISSSLSGVVGSDVQATSMAIYGTHLSLLAVVSLLLWLDVHRRVAAHRQVVRASLALILFVSGLAAGMVRPTLAQYFWFATFGVPLVGNSIARRLRRA